MPRYFFDLHDGGSTIDDTGLAIDTLEEVRRLAIQTLPDIARDEMTKQGSYRTITVFVTDQDEKPVYSATLTFSELWLLR